jgi:hypothetical protein
MALEDPLQHVVSGGGLRVEAIGRVTRVEDDGVARVDLEAGRAAVVPVVVNGVGVEGVRLHGPEG